MLGPINRTLDEYSKVLQNHNAVAGIFSCVLTALALVVTVLAYLAPVSNDAKPAKPVAAADEPKAEVLVNAPALVELKPAPVREAVKNKPIPAPEVLVNAPTPVPEVLVKSPTPVDWKPEDGLPLDVKTALAGLGNPDKGYEKFGLKTKEDGLPKVMSRFYGKGLMSSDGFVAFLGKIGAFELMLFPEGSLGFGYIDNTLETVFVPWLENGFGPAVTVEPTPSEAYPGCFEYRRPSERSGYMLARRK